MYYILYFLPCFLSILCRKYYYDSNFKEYQNTNRLFFWLGSFLGEIIVFLAVILFPNPYSGFRTLFIILLNFAINLALSFFYQSGHFGTRLLIVFSFQAIIALTEVATGAVFSFISPDFASSSEIMQNTYVTTFSGILSFLIVSVICSLGIGNRDALPFRHFFLTCTTPACSLLVLLIMPFQIIVSGSNSLRIFFLLVILLSLNITNHLLIKDVIRQVSLEEMIQNQKKQLTYQAEKFHQLSNAYKETRRIVHEVKRYNSYITSCVRKEEYDKIIDFVQNSNRELENRFVKFNTGNLVIDTFLTNYDTMAHSLGIDYSTTVRIDKDEIPVNDYDLCILLGNLIDNSFNERTNWKQVKGSYDKYNINVQLMTQNHFFVIHVSNSLINNKFVNTDSLFHGFGTLNVKNIVEKYNGIYFQDSSENEYATTISIPILRDSSGKMLLPHEFQSFSDSPPPEK